MRLLDSKDFVVERHASDPQKFILKPKLEGDSLVLFFGTNCKFCPALKAALSELKLDDRFKVQLAMVNLTIYSELVQLSQKTTTPIKYVPLILYYSNSIPYKQFDGNGTIENLTKFITDVYILSKTPPPDAAPKPLEQEIQQLTSKKVCYLNFESAYDNK